MPFKTDIEIAQGTTMNKISEIAAGLGVDEKYVEQYGPYKAKIDYNLLPDMADKPNGKLVLVTAITPTPAGEGKTTTTVGLADGLRAIGKKSVVALREPSLGPVFGIKGGAAGGGYAQVVPMEDINLHFTGDFHAIGAANNLLAAMLDNHIHQGNELGIDVRRITWKRAVDMNDRQLRFITDGLGGRANGVPREDGFDITVASEVMAVLCLSSDIDDLKARLAQIIVGYTRDEKPVTCGELKAAGAMASLSQTWCRLWSIPPPSSMAGPSPTSRTAATASWPRVWPSNWGIMPSRKPVSVRIWARKSSSISSAAWRASPRTRW